MDKKEATRRIGDIVESRCRNCKTRQRLFSEPGGVAKNQMKLQKYCDTKCKAGKRIKRARNVIEYGVYRLNPVGSELTKEKYIKLSEDHRDRDITKMYGVSRQLLNERKAHWGLMDTHNGGKGFRYKRSVTKERVMELLEENTTEKTAEILDIPYNTLQKRMRKWDIKRPSKMDQFSPEEYNYLRKKGLTYKEIAELWEVTQSGLYAWRKRTENVD